MKRYFLSVALLVLFVGCSTPKRVQDADVVVIVNKVYKELCLNKTIEKMVVPNDRRDPNTYTLDDMYDRTISEVFSEEKSCKDFGRVSGVNCSVVVPDNPDMEGNYTCVVGYMTRKYD
jgi:hypothetical protein